MTRIEEPDLVYRTATEKYDAIVADIIEKQQQGRPVLVGTVSSRSPSASRRMLKRRGIKHVVLNAKYHAQEAEIVAQAGRMGAVTIATNMAGRGTDILLGGNPEYMARQQSLAEDVAQKLERGEETLSSTTRSSSTSRTATTTGCHAPIGSASTDTSRGSARPSITRWWRRAACTSSAPSGTKRGASTTSCAAALDARATRVSSRFYLSLEDDLMRIFGSDRISGLMQRLGMEEGVPSSTAWSLGPSSARRSRSKRRTSPSASTCSNTTTS